MNDDKIIELEEISPEEEQHTSDPEFAFWDEFYKRKEKDEPFTVKKHDDGNAIRIRGDLPKIHTN